MTDDRKRRISNTYKVCLLYLLQITHRMITHHVFFWLKNPSSSEDRKKLMEGLSTLQAIKTVKKLSIGVPAPTEDRTVIDSSYQVSELMLFDTVEDQKSYQDDPIHKKFVEDYSSLWEKVVVYDVEVWRSW